MRYSPLSLIISTCAILACSRGEDLLVRQSQQNVVANSDASTARENVCETRGPRFPSPWVAHLGSERSFGVRVTGGDLNGDSRPDIVVGASNWPQVDQSAIGSVQVYLGSNEGISYEQAWSRTGSHSMAQMGIDVAIGGDWNRDGYKDLAVGMVGWDNFRGSVWQFVGSRAFWWPHNARAVEGGNDYRNLGSRIAAAGDVNGDGYDDLLVHGGTDAGAAVLYLGSRGGLSETPSWKLTGTHPGDRVGLYLSGLDDLNQDRFDDFAVTAGPRRVYLYFGSASGPSAPVDLNFSSVPGEVGRVTGLGAAGDVNRDGIMDLLVAFERRAYLYLGTRTGISSDPVWDHIYGLPLHRAVVEGVGDVNGDGHDDCILGANDTLYLHLGSSQGLCKEPFWLWRLEQGMGEFSDAGAVGDVNRDGLADFVVGITAHGTSHVISAGRAVLLLGQR